MASRPLFALLSLFFTGGALLLMFFMLLAGAINANPVGQWYFLQADTSGISGAPALSRWTFWNACPVNSNGRNQCGHVHPAYPLNPPGNFNSNQGIPPGFVGTHKYYYLTRFMFAFMLIALFFATCALFTGVLAICSRIGSYLSGLLASIALFFQTLTAALMTAAYVEGRDAFRANGNTASIGKTAFGFEWAAMVCLLISTIFYCLAGGSSRKDSTAYGSNRRSFFGGKRSKSTRSRGSFINGDATHDNKEYA